jgi:anti-anti-sigma factor
MFKSIYNENEKILTCIFEGHIDTARCAGYDQKLKDTLKKTAGTNPETSPDFKLVFDLAEVSYIASSFIRVCVNAAKQVPRGRFSIVNSKPFIKKTFKIVGLDDLLHLS